MLRTENFWLSSSEVSFIHKFMRFRWLIWSRGTVANHNAGSVLDNTYLGLAQNVRSFVVALDASLSIEGQVSAVARSAFYNL